MRKYLIIIGIVVSTLLSATIGSSVMAYSPFGDVCNTTGQGNVSNSTLCSTQTSTQDPVSVKILHVAQLLDLVIGVVAIVMIIVGGLRFIISGGNSNAVSGARNQIIYALVGLVLAAVAQAIIIFVINELTN